MLRLSLTDRVYPDPRPSVGAYEPPGGGAPINTGANGTNVRIVGHGFGPNTGTVDFGAGIMGAVVSWDDCVIVATIPARGAYPYTSVTTVTAANGNSTQGPTFTTT